MPVTTVESQAANLRPPAPWTTRDLLLLLAITALATAVRLVSIEQWSWSQTEAETWCALTQPIDADADADADGLAANPASRYSVAFLLLRWLWHTGLLPGHTEGWLRLPFAFAGAVAIPLVALLARRQVGIGAARLAAVLLAVHPAHVAASQTANPLVLAISIAMVAGLLAARGARWLALPVTLLAGACHPIAWPLALGLVVAAELAPGTAAADRLAQWLGRVPPRVLPFVWLLLWAPLLPLVPRCCEELRLPLLLLAALAVPVLTDHGGRFAFAALLPLWVGAVSGWCGVAAGEHAGALATLPAALLLATGVATRFLGVVGDLLSASRWLVRCVGAAPAVILIGESATALFLYLTVFGGGRPPWREVKNTALTTVQHGGQLELVAGRGLDVLRSYLRPSHWLRPQDDPHPGVRLAPLLLPGRSIADLAAELASPAVLLALQQDELELLRTDPAGRALLDQFVVLRVWPCPRPDGDASLYLLQRRDRS